VAPEAATALDRLFSRYRIAGIVDAASVTPGTELRDHLARGEILDYFDMVGTTAEFGPELSPRVLRRILRALGGPDERTLLVTGRRHLVAGFGGSRVPVVYTAFEDFAAVPEAVESLLGGGRVNP
jgi:phosphoglycolate phosphatase-like HAD superfamily hydrolase